MTTLREFCGLNLRPGETPEEYAERMGNDQEWGTRARGHCGMRGVGMRGAPPHL